MAERQIEHRKSCLVFSQRFTVVNWRSRPVAKSAYSVVFSLYTVSLGFSRSCNETNRVEETSLSVFWTMQGIHS